MHVALLVAEIVAPVIVLGLIGFTWARAGMDFPMKFVTGFVMKLSIPCLLFSTLIATELPTDVLISTGIAALLGYLALGLVFLGIVRLRGLDLRTFLIPLTFGNTGNLGMPLALFAFGQAGFDLAVVVFAVSAILIFTIGVWVVSGERFSIKTVIEPSTMAILAAVVFMSLDIGLPRWAMTSVSLLGQPAIPLMLFTLGVSISAMPLARAKGLIGISAIRIAICFGVAWGIATILSLQPVPFAVLVMQLSTPVAVTSAVMAGAYGADAEDVAGLVLITTLASVLTLPLILSLFV